MWCCDKYCVATDSVHVNTGTSLNIIKVNISILCDEECNAMLLTHLEEIT
jgi:hypothetical protein